MTLNQSILIADHNAAYCELFSEVLLQLNFGGNVTIINDGTELIRIINAPDFAPPSLIFLDIDLTCLNEINCLTAIRNISLYNCVPVIMLSINARPKAMLESFTNGASRYIAKVSSSKRFKSVIKKILTTDTQLLLAPHKSNFLIS